MKFNNLGVLNVHPRAKNPHFIKELHHYNDVVFFVYYPVYTFKVALVVYNDQFIWDWDSSPVLIMIVKMYFDVPI
eukprot:XP_763825.1 hypothetical protein [Theileria parva strain Muguga]